MLGMCAHHPIRNRTLSPGLSHHDASSHSPHAAGSVRPRHGLWHLVQGRCNGTPCAFKLSKCASHTYTLSATRLLLPGRHGSLYHRRLQQGQLAVLRRMVWQKCLRYLLHGLLRRLGQHLWHPGVDIMRRQERPCPADQRVPRVRLGRRCLGRLHHVRRLPRRPVVRDLCRADWLRPQCGRLQPGRPSHQD